LEVPMQRNGVIFGQAEKREIGSLKCHLACVSPEIDGRSPVSGSCKSQTIIISQPR
jgi:hypothetical protein